MPEVDFATWRARVEAALDRSLPSAQASPQRLHAAMRHGVLNGGKRMRPLLVYASGSALGADAADLDAAAVAVELIHCYSLVHDDLPAMDDDALRRGQPTVHVAFDEATAILAGDALQSLAFEVLAAAPQCDARKVAMLAELARASGMAGMCGGRRWTSMPPAIRKGVIRKGVRVMFSVGRFRLLMSFDRKMTLTPFRSPTSNACMR